MREIAAAVFSKTQAILVDLYLELAPSLVAHITMMVAQSFSNKVAVTMGHDNTIPDGPSAALGY